MRDVLRDNQRTILPRRCDDPAVLRAAATRAGP